MTLSTSIRSWFRDRIQWVKMNPLLTILCSLLVVLFSAFMAVMFSETVEETQDSMFLGLVGLLFMLLLIFLYVFFSNNPQRFLEKLGASDKFQALKFLGLSMGGILFVMQIAISAGVNQNAEQGLRQERLKNAIEHLGNSAESVRLGGAYELFHLAEDIKELRWTAFDILCAHIRQTTGEKKYRGEYESKPSEEIQSLLSLLVVQDHKVFDGLNINLQGSWLKGADLAGARLENAVLNNARLQGTNLRGVHLQKARLEGAHLQGARLWGAHLQGATLRRAHLQGATLGEAHLQETDLFRAYLQGTDLFAAHLQKAALVAAHLQGARLWGAHLQGANLIEAHLQGVFSSGGKFPVEFAERMRKGIGQQGDLSNVVFAGGLTEEKVDAIVKDFSDEKARQLRAILELHIDKPGSNQLPKDSLAITGTYTKEEAEKWIAEYEKAMSEVPKADNGY